MPTGKNPSHCHYVHHISHVDWPRIEPRPPSARGRRLTASAMAQPQERFETGFTLTTANKIQRGWFPQECGTRWKISRPTRDHNLFQTLRKKLCLYLGMLIRLATHMSFVFGRGGEQSLCRRTDINLQRVIKNSTKLNLKCCVGWYQPMLMHRANDELQIGFWSTTDTTGQPRAINGISWRENLNLMKAVPWFRRLVAGLSPRRPGFDPGSVGSCGGQSGTLTGFPPEYFGFPLSISFHRCSITWKNKKNWLSFSSSSSQGMRP
jgi:hypothetical protein